jgi:lysozyme family protein
MDFDSAFNRLLGFEGGFSSNPDDPGGATRFGITEAVARKHGYTGDMESLPQQFAKLVYQTDFWDRCDCDALPDQIRYAVFDAAVNSGAVQSIKWLQAAAGMAPDGIIGPATMSSVKGSDPVVLLMRLCGARLGFLTTLPGWATFGKGWARRIASILTQ